MQGGFNWGHLCAMSMAREKGCAACAPPRIRLGAGFRPMSSTGSGTQQPTPSHAVCPLFPYNYPFQPSLGLSFNPSNYPHQPLLCVGAGQGPGSLCRSVPPHDATAYQPPMAHGRRFGSFRHRGPRLPAHQQPERHVLGGGGGGGGRGQPSGRRRQSGNVCGGDGGGVEPLVHQRRDDGLRRRRRAALRRQLCWWHARVAARGSAEGSRPQPLCQLRPAAAEALRVRTSCWVDRHAVTWQGCSPQPAVTAMQAPPGASLGTVRERTSISCCAHKLAAFSSGR